MFQQLIVLSYKCIFVFRFVFNHRYTIIKTRENQLKKRLEQLELLLEVKTKEVITKEDELTDLKKTTKNEVIVEYIYIYIYI